MGSEMYASGTLPVLRSVSGPPEGNGNSQCDVGHDSGVSIRPPP